MKRPVEQKPVNAQNGSSRIQKKLRIRAPQVSNSLDSSPQPPPLKFKMSKNQSKGNHQNAQSNLESEAFHPLQSPENPKLKHRNISKIQKPLLIPQSDSITIVFGTYEHILYGINISFSPSDPAPTVTTLFHFVAHRSPLNTLALPPFPANPTLATSAADTPLTLWSVSKRRCLGTLSSGLLAANASGAAREPGVQVARFDRLGKILVVGDETGGMTVYRTCDWALVRKFTGSGKGRVNDLSIEPQKGRLMLSVGQDRCLRMWDLSGGKDKGKPMASVRLGAEAERLGWSESGKKLVVVTGRIATVYDTMMVPLFTFTSPKGRVHDCKFFIDQRSEEYLFLACDDSVGRIFRLGHSTVNSDTEPQCVAELVGHSNRVKAIEIVTLDRAEKCTYAVTISSDGFCHLYKLLSSEWDNRTNPFELQPVTKYDTGGCRLTCLAAVAVSSDNGLKSSPEQVDRPDENVSLEDEDEEAGIDLDANGEPLIFDQSDGSSE